MALQFGGDGEEDIDRDYLNCFVYRYVGKGALFCSSAKGGGSNHASMLPLCKRVQSFAVVDRKSSIQHKLRSG